MTPKKLGQKPNKKGSVSYLHKVLCSRIKRAVEEKTFDIEFYIEDTLLFKEAFYQLKSDTEELNFFMLRSKKYTVKINGDYIALKIKDTDILKDYL